ncbi:HIT family protein [Desertibaculum subflavum]|uniref:HIT family protein n=1 Tax=Desertibaculum subflavum TaxID=2268458 RepID=UPI000E65FB60
MSTPPTDPDCPFCRIVAGSLPSARLWEDDLTVAFLDIRPFSEGHALAVAKGHWPDLRTVPARVMGAVAETAHRVGNAVWRVVGADGFTLMQANGEAANQTVPHFHIHLMPRRDGDGGFRAWRDAKPADPASLLALAERIRAALQR